MRSQRKVYNGVAGVTTTAYQMEQMGGQFATMAKVAAVLKVQPQQGQTSWRDPAQLRMTLFTSRDGWDSSVGWL